MVAAIIIQSHGTETRPVAVATPSTPALHPPPPAIADLLRALPPSGGSGGLPIPELSGFDTQAAAYRGRLTLSARQLLAEPHDLSAYRLAGPSFDVSRVPALARHLGINRPVVGRQSRVDQQMWDIAATGGPGSSGPLHSLAISRHTGELIYHSEPGGIPLTRATPLDRVRAVSLARRWIVALGWPAGMPVVAAAPDMQLLPPSAGVPWPVSFGWRGVGAAAVTQATVIVMPDGDVIEARLWPPVRRVGHVDTTDVRTAWSVIQQGRVPITVQGMGQMRVAGIGSLHRIAVIHALDTTGSAPYLIPMYRFAGTVRISGLGVHAWSAVVSAVSAS